MVLRRCAQLLGVPENAKDAMHDVFTRLLDHHSLKVIYPSSFLYTMATRICLDMIKSAEYRHGGNASLLDLIAQVDDLENRTYAKIFLDRIFRNEQKSTRVIAVMHYIDGMTFAEIGKELSMSESGVRRRMQKLKQQISHSGMAQPNNRPTLKTGKEI